MNIIKTYLDNMFTSLPKTKDVSKLKDNLLVDMEEKYEELITQGKTENEAIGIVISEFGNIEELAKELGVNIYDFEAEKKIITMDEAENYLKSNHKNGRLIALGVLLCICSPIILLLLTSSGSEVNLWQTTKTIIGIVALLILIAIALGLFIYAGLNLDKFNYLRDDVIIPKEIKETTKIKEENFNNKFTIGLISSIVLFILSPVVLIIFGILNDELGYKKYNSNLGVAILLIAIAIGVFTLINIGITKDGYNVLQQTDTYKRKKKKSENIVGTIGSIYWPLVTIAYLLWSFIGKAWDISWIIWIIAGISFGIISAIVSTTTKDETL